MEEDIKSDLQDSLEILKADKFKQGRDYSQQVITDIEKVLNDLHSNPKHKWQKKIYIQCERCWKKIEKKMNRVLCIRCRYEVDKENAEKRRNDPEYKQMYMEKYKRNQTK